MEIDALQIRIEKAKASLPEETKMAIDAVDWRGALLDIKTKKGFSVEKLEDLELETELMLVGLVDPTNYEKEIRERMDLSPVEAKEIVEEMNDKVFKKIRDEFAKIMTAKNTEGQNTTQTAAENKQDTAVLKQAGIEVITSDSAHYHTENKEEVEDVSIKDREDMLQKVENPDLIEKMPAATLQKMAGAFNLPAVKTEYSLDNMTKENQKKTEVTPQPIQKTTPPLGEKSPTVDPYRMPIE